MNDKTLDELLRESTDDEISHRNFHNKSYIEQPIKKIDGILQVSEMDCQFFQHGNVYVGRHSRYAKMLPHKHSFVELNYMYSGSCVQYINNKKIVLKKGQLLLMDKDTIHSINSLNEDDILINILIKDDSISTELLTQVVQSQSLIYEFLVNAAANDIEHDFYLLLETENNNRIQSLIINIMKYYFDRDKYSIQSIILTLPLLFIELSRQLENQTIKHIDETQSDIIEILNYIDNNYADVNLSLLSQLFGYNKNYISQKLKMTTGYCFTELMDRKKLNIAIYLMRKDEISIENIAYQIGYETPSAFYKLFKKYYHMTPLQYKKQFTS